MKYLDEIKAALQEEDFYLTDNIISKVRHEKDAFDYIEPLLQFMEGNPELDFGQPGPIVHFMESFDGYEKLLVESIKRMPISHTIWMLNRVINDPNLKNRKKYLKLMKEQLRRKDISDELKEEIEDFVSFQEDRA